MTTTPTTQLLELPRPVVTGVLPDDPEWDQVHLVPISAIAVPLDIEVPAWQHIPIPDQKTILRFYRTTATTNYLLETREWPSGAYPAIPDQDRQFSIRIDGFGQGVHQFWYELTLPNGSADESACQPVTIDLTSPQLGANAGQLSVDTDTVTEQYLIDNGDQLLADVPVYTGFAPGDVITWYWSEDPFNVLPGDEVGSRTVYRNDSQPLSVVFAGDMIRDRGDGERHAFYQLKDRAGNTTGYSQAVRLTVQARPVPRLLPAPHVKEAVGLPVGSLDPFNARAGVTVVIPDTAVFKPGDSVQVQWAEPGEFGAYLSPAADASVKEVTVPAAYIPQHMGRQITVLYQVSGPSGEGRSEPYDLQVRLMGQTYWRTIQCIRPAIAAGQLRLSTVVDHATFLLGQWAFMAVGQRLTITLVANGAQKIIRDRYAVTPEDISAQGVSTDVPKSELQALPLGALTVRVTVSFDQGATAVPFPSLNLTLVQ